MTTATKPKTGAQSRFAQAQYDRAGSTFRHIIMLVPGQEYKDKFGNVKVNKADSFIFYSKRQGFNEPADKEKLLQDEILRLSENGYLARTHRIELYVNDFLQGEHIHIATLYKSTYEMGCSIYSNHVLIRFLEQLYEKIEGKRETVFTKKSHRGRVKHDPFDESKTFATRERAISYCKMLETSGEERGRVVAYWHKIAAKHNYWQQEGGAK